MKRARTIHAPPKLVKTVQKWVWNQWRRAYDKGRTTGSEAKRFHFSDYLEGWRYEKLWDKLDPDTQRELIYGWGGLSEFKVEIIFREPRSEESRGVWDAHKRILTIHFATDYDLDTAFDRIPRIVRHELQHVSQNALADIRDIGTKRMYPPSGNYALDPIEFDPLLQDAIEDWNSNFAPKVLQADPDEQHRLQRYLISIYIGERSSHLTNKWFETLHDQDKSLWKKAVGTFIDEIEKPSAARVASRWLSRTAARPIRLPTREIRALAKSLTRKLKQRGLPKPNRVVAEDWLSLTNVMGDDVDIEIILVGSPRVELDKGDLLHGAYLKKNPAPLAHKMAIYLNAYLPPATFAKRPDRIIEADLYRILTHELTHAADIWHGKGSVGDLSKSREELKRHHHNHPAEVRALMRDVVTEVEPTVRDYLEDGMPFKMALEYALEDSKWPEIKPYLTDRNRKTILKGVYTHLQDQGLT